MIIRPSATFRADFPNDTVWDENGEQVLQTAGQALARAFTNVLKGAGCTVSEPEDHLEHGWEIDAAFKGYDFWMQVTYLERDECYYYSKQRGVPLFGRRRHREAYAEFLSLVNTAIRADPRFHDFRWYAALNPRPEDFNPEPVSP